MGKRLIVEPRDCLLVDDIAMRCEDLNQYEIVEIEAEMVDNFGERWVSAAMYQANVFGDIDLAKAAPILGSYSKPCSMGLFWSMKRKPGFSGGVRTPLKPLKTSILLKRQGATNELIQVVRHLVHPSLIKESLRHDNVIGTFFHHGDRRQRPTLLVLGGSEGGKREAQAALLAAKGFNTLAVAYFGIEGLPDQLVNIPIDYFQKVMCWLEEHPLVDANRIGVVGTSKGGELALLLASYEPKIKAVVAYAPSSVIHRGIGEVRDGEYPSSWSFFGEPLSFAYNNDKVKTLTRDLLDQKNACQAVSYREWYRIHTEAAKEENMISVENINGPIQVISGDDDQLWPSDLFGKQIMDRLKKHSFSFSIEHHCFQKAGHAIGYPGMPTTETAEFKFGSFTLKTGGTPEGNYMAQADSWKKVISFLKQSL
jgi:dienelactone hydrolase